MGIFFKDNHSSNRVTEHEYKKTGGIRSRIMARIPGSWGKKNEKMSEIDTALHGAFDAGGHTKMDDGADPHELNAAKQYLLKNEAKLDVDKKDIEIAFQELEKGK